MGRYTSVEKVAGSITHKDVLEWITKNGQEGCTKELKQLASECSEFIDGISDVIHKHMECAAFFHVGISFGLHVVKADDDIEAVFESYAGPGAKQVRDKFSMAGKEERQEDAIFDSRDGCKPSIRDKVKLLMALAALGDMTDTTHNNEDKEEEE